jgi:hypothetical protein
VSASSCGMCTRAHVQLLCVRSLIIDELLGKLGRVRPRPSYDVAAS